MVLFEEKHCIDSVFYLITIFVLNLIKYFQNQVSVFIGFIRIYCSLQLSQGLTLTTPLFNLTREYPSEFKFGKTQTDIECEVCK